MKCPRCNGCLTPTPPPEEVGFYLQATEAQWRCINCGNMLDSTILRNRLVGRRED